MSSLADNSKQGLGVRQYCLESKISGEEFGLSNTGMRRKVPGRSRIISYGRKTPTRFIAQNIQRMRLRFVSTFVTLGKLLGGWTRQFERVRSQCWPA